MEHLRKTLGSRKKAVILGVVFLLSLAFAYVVNATFFGSLESIFADPMVAVLMLFVHNVLAVSLIIVGMTFYVEYVVSALAGRRKIELVVVEHPRPFAVIFTVIVLLMSILRATMLYRQAQVSSLPFYMLLTFIVLLSLPHGMVEGYGIFLSILKTLKKELTLKDLAVIYSIFFIAALIEVGFGQFLRWIATP